MKIVGHRTVPGIAAAPCGPRLEEGARANDALRAFPGGGNAFIPKGVYRFRSHELANRHWEECLAAAIARLARQRR